MRIANRGIYFRSGVMAIEKRLVVGALGNCTNREDVEMVFNRFNVINFDEKTDLLLSVMDNPELFFSVGEPTPEQKYELVLESFLSMSWKFALMCKRGTVNG